MLPLVYQEEVKRTMGSLNRQEALCAWSMGLAGEVGEVIEPIKKHVFHGRPLDLTEIEKELGDVLWYCAALCNALDLYMDVIMQRNILKLKERYPDGFVRHQNNPVDGFKRADE